jgi:hypothetical protein
MSDATAAPPPPAQAPPPGARVDAPPGVDFPGKTLGIVGLILSIVSSIIGLIISIVANSQSKAAGYTNTPAKIGIIIGAIMTAIGLIIGIVAIIIAVVAGANVLEACAGLGPGVHEVNGVTYTCG